MIKVDSANAGTDARIRIITHDEDNLIVDADSAPTVSIFYGEVDFDTELLAATAMTRDSLGTYDYWWDTELVDTDVYLITCVSIVDGNTSTTKTQFRVMD